MRAVAGVFLLMIVVAVSSSAQTGEVAQSTEHAQELAKQLSNPVASLVSVPFQISWDSSVGIEDDTRFLLNFQPVLPFALNNEWNLIARLIVPMAQPALVNGSECVDRNIMRNLP